MKLDIKFQEAETTVHHKKNLSNMSCDIDSERKFSIATTENILFFYRIWSSSKPYGPKTTKSTDFRYVSHVSKFRPSWI